MGIKKNPSNETSRGHICYQVRNLNAFEENLRANGVEIIPDHKPISGYARFYLRDPALNRIEIANKI